MCWTRFFRRARWDKERASELESYLDIETDENLTRGLSPSDARQAALRKLGNSTLIREEIYHMNSLTLLESLWQDVRYSARALAKSPAFTFVVIASLALGIGANTVIFSLINAALLKMLPVRNPEQLVQLKNLSSAIGLNDAFSYPAFKEMSARSRAFAGLFAFRKLNDVDFEMNGQSELAKGQAVSGNYFSALGINPVLGRAITPGDEKAAEESPVAVIGYDYWRERFALDPVVIGKKVVINNSPFTIIGVTPPGFFGLEPGQRIDVYVPLTMIDVVRHDWAATGSPYDALTAPFRNWLNVMARLESGVTGKEAIASLAPTFAQCMREAAQGLAGLPIDSPQVRHALLATRLRIEPGGQGLAALRAQFSKPLWIVMAIVALLLLVACANVANLMLARAAARHREIAVRLTVGAGRRRLISQLITESVLLAMVGGGLGLLLASAASRELLLMMSPPDSPVLLNIQPDITILGFTLAVSLFTALLCGFIPAWRAARVDLAPALVESMRSSGRATSRSKMAKTLIILQVAASLVLLTGAGLLARSLENLKNFYPGFNKENVLLLSITPSVVGYKDQVLPLFNRLVYQIQRISGVRSVSYSIYSPLGRGYGSTTPKIEGALQQSGKEFASVGMNVVGPKYFTTLQTPLLAGRDFADADRAGAPKVTIINETMERNFFGSVNPLGRHLSVPGWVGDASWLEIVGVVADSKNHQLREKSAPMIYLPLLQAPESDVTFEVRTAIDPRSLSTTIERAVKAADARLPISGVKTLSAQVDDSLIQERLVASLSSLFGVLALLLAAVGLYGLMTYIVNRRTGEIGIRMALGARRGEIGAMILREILLLFSLGLLIGIPAALGASRLISSELYGLKADDPSTIVCAALFMATVAVVASYLPARRAACVDPMVALRHE